MPATSRIESEIISGTKLKVVMGVKTLNRLEYLKEFVNSWEKTKSDRYDWTLVIHDDGSSDGTLEYISSIEPDGYNLVGVARGNLGVSHASNSIIREAINAGYDFGFCADDDIFFLKEGWDEKYISTSIETGVDHLCFYHKSWSEPEHSIKKNGLESKTTVQNCMGCLWTFTPKMIQTIGFFDPTSFGVCGFEHVDFSARACRAGFNNAETFYDIEKSEKYIGMHGLNDEDYIFSLPEHVRVPLWEDDYRIKSLKVVNTYNRVFIPETTEYFRYLCKKNG